jgi:lipooligosaccharide transport system ATP-binding protein
MEAPIVALSAVSKRFGDRLAVDAVSLDVAPGTCHGLLGPNGAGKTTTLRMIYGVTRPTTGTVHVFGLDVQREPRVVRRRLGVTLQENALIDVLSPEENLRVFGRYHLLEGRALEHRVGELMELFELRSHAGVPVRRLSGGFQRRLAVARSLVNQPELLILDEPTTGLDPGVRQALWAKIRDLRRAGTTVLLTTHYMDEAERLCDEVAIFARGRIDTAGSPPELIARHLAPEAIELDCPPELETALLDGLPRLRTGSRVIAYTADAAPVLERLRHVALPASVRPIVRPTNLEDVFLAVTGAGLEESEA